MRKKREQVYSSIDLECWLNENLAIILHTDFTFKSLSVAMAIIFGSSTSWMPMNSVARSAPWVLSWLYRESIFLKNRTKFLKVSCQVLFLQSGFWKGLNRIIVLALLHPDKPTCSTGSWTDLIARCLGTDVMCVWRLYWSEQSYI